MQRLASKRTISYFDIYTLVEKFLIEDPLLIEGLFYCGDHLLDKQILSYHIQTIFSLHKRTYILVKMLLFREISVTKHSEQLFREDSFNSVFIQHYIRSSCKNWIIQTLSSTMKDIISCKHSLEINPILLSKQDKLLSNIKYLKKFTSNILTTIWNNYKYLPSDIIRTCKYLFSTTNEKFNGSGYFGISSFLFLRFICPLISSPTSFTTHSVEKHTQRNLILITKIIQRIATLNLSQTTEDYIKPLQSFISDNTRLMLKFYDNIININMRVLSTIQSKQVRRRSTSTYKLISKEYGGDVKFTSTQYLLNIIHSHYDIMYENIFSSMISKNDIFLITIKRCSILKDFMLNDSNMINYDDLLDDLETYYDNFICPNGKFGTWDELQEEMRNNNILLPQIERKLIYSKYINTEQAIMQYRFSNAQSNSLIRTITA